MVVADFLLEKDRIFTPVVLNEDEQQLFADLKQKILPQYPAPDLVIYLQTAVDGNRKRLQKRGDGIINLSRRLFGADTRGIQPVFPPLSKFPVADRQC